MVQSRTNNRKNGLRNSEDPSKREYKVFFSNEGETRERETNRQTDRQIDRQRQRLRERQTERDAL